MSEKQAEILIAHLRYGNLTEKQKEEEIKKAEADLKIDTMI